MPSDAFERLAIRLGDIDDLMRGHAAVGGMERGRRYGVEGINRAAVVMLCAHLEGYVEDLIREALRAVDLNLNADTVVAGFHNPWPDRIDALFSMIGIERVCSGISWRRAGVTAVRRNLEALVHTRNRLAHGAPDVAVSKVMVTRFRKYVEGFARGLDEAVAIHLVATMNRAAWVPAAWE